ncbi:MAG TPA: ABC transporter ATP-binding protein [Usitatibacter sp.]|nr:ABC transporter ATP-binding protein [Usitatibacter sp.]
MPGASAANAVTPASADVIEVLGVGKRFRSRSGKATSVFEDVSLSIRRGEFVLLLGPSGCGKSTLLNMIAGFEPPSEGRILQDSTPVLRPDARRTMVFQDVQGSLFPWLSAQANVEFGLRMAGMPSAQRTSVASRYLKLVGLDHAASKMPFELSGGMKQRVQIARALATDPEVLLMDEPFGALDAQSRNVLQAELERIWQATKKTIVFVTHDIAEAVRLADRIVVFGTGPAAKIVEVIEVDLPRPRVPTSLEVARLAQDIGTLFSRFALHAQEGAA